MYENMTKNATWVLIALNNLEKNYQQIMSKMKKNKEIYMLACYLE